MASEDRTTRHSSSRFPLDQVPPGEEPVRPYPTVFLAAYLGGYRSCRCLGGQLQKEELLIRLGQNSDSNVPDQESHMNAEEELVSSYRVLIAKFAHNQLWSRT